MISFLPDILKEQIFKAINDLKYLEGDIEEIEFQDILSCEEIENDIQITEDSQVCIYVGECDFPRITVKEFIHMSVAIDELSINSNQNYAKSSTEVYFLLDSSDYKTAEVLYNTFKSGNIFAQKENKPLSVLEKRVTIGEKTYTCSLFNGFCIFHLLVQKSGDFDEYAPSYSPDEYFIKISCDQKIHMKEADSLAHAYVFELQSSFDLCLPFSTGRIAPFYPDRSDESLHGLESKLFPLICGAGTAELLSLYNTAKATVDLDFKILGFTKVIEYIAPTIAQKTLIENVTLKLTSLNVFKPTAKYISELGEIYEKHRNISNRDSELIRLSIITAVSLDEIWDKIPNFIKGKQTSISEEKEQFAFLEKIAEYVYNTRNEIAHAKANYEKKGTECPQKHKFDFCEMLDLISVRCIRWFALQPEDKRVVLN